MERETKVKELVVEIDPDPESDRLFIVHPETEVAAPVAPEARAPQPSGPAPETDLAPAVPERLVLTAEREIVLQVGEASITLTRAGKIILRGTYVSSRSSGVNRIRGGSVQIN